MQTYGPEQEVKATRSVNVTAGMALAAGLAGIAYLIFKQIKGK
jgi:hypothetical protein